MFKLSDYGYDLPKARIAQTPCKNRSDARLLHINRAKTSLTHHRFDQLTKLLRKDDLLVINNTRVVPARLLGKKKTGGRVEVLIIDYASGIQCLEENGYFQCDCLVKASKSPGAGERVFFENDVQARIIQRKGYISEVRFLNGPGFVEFLKNTGKIPLPPYIHRDTGVQHQADNEDYQTVYAQKEGAVAAPTAGLHFTQSLMKALSKKGIEFAPITLHVGYGTFVPVRVDDIRDHEIHSEFFSLSNESAKKINTAKKTGRRVVAVGTTSVRTLEYLSCDTGIVTAKSGMCDLFIYPGYTFRCVDAVITNFHLPESTLLMLVSAFHTRKKMLEAYKTAVDKEYRFFSYGDAMLID
ncbi:MAG: tRNA preQ1(34) S-adenosylmethionine ribosyltransferase-isomerase QueA [Desulfobacula sp.]|nr:tRNA preQ1(34) S-adenosylmethionine ribosyltransferase-isomerase QueA [Desulfobacula sp.]